MAQRIITTMGFGGQGTDRAGDSGRTIASKVNANFTELYTAISALPSNIADADFDNINDRFQTLANTLQELQTWAQSSDNNLASVIASIDGMQSQMQAMQDAQAIDGNAVFTHAGQIKDLQDGMAAMAATMSSFDALMSNKLDTQRSDLTILAEDLNSQKPLIVQNSNNITALGGRVTTLEGNVGPTSTTVNANTAAISSLTTQVNSATVSAGLANSNVNALSTTVAGEQAKTANHAISISNLNAGLATETQARQTADTAETGARIAGDKTNSDALAAEVTARQGGDATNASAISAESTTRATADTNNANAIAAEVTARQAAVTAEATARTNADTAEATARAAADTAETTARQNADTTNANAISAEVTARQTAVATEVTDRQAAVSAEATARIAGDAAILPSVIRFFVASSTSATAVRMTSDGAAATAANVWPLANNSARYLQISALARQTGGTSGTVGDSAIWFINTMITRGASASVMALGDVVSFKTVLGLLSLVLGPSAVQPTTSTGSGANWRLNLSTDTTNGALAVTGVGEASKNISWKIRVDFVEL